MIFHALNKSYRVILRNKIKTAFGKFLFCWRISSDVQSFFRLIYFAKRYKIISSTSSSDVINDAKPVKIRLRFNHRVRTIFLRPYRGDIEIFFEIFFRQSYRLPKSTMRNVSVIVDIGSNVGFSAMYFLENAPGAKIYCVEPDSENFAMLSRNLPDDISKWILTTCEAAVMDKDGSVSFLQKRNGFNSHVDESGDRVSAITMHTLIQRYHLQTIDLLKIDIEGAEKYLFSGDCSWLKKVQAIVIELHSEEDHSLVFSSLKQYGFNAGRLTNDAANTNIFFAEKNAR